MEIWLLDTDFSPLTVVDTFESLIWTERYQECGDFELYLGASLEAVQMFLPGRYFWYGGSDRIMIIEKIRINSDSENGDHLTVTGADLSSLLKRRIVWSQTNITGSLQDGIKKLLDENIIAPTDNNRKIDNFIFEESTDSRIASLTLEAQYAGDNLYDVITAACAEAGIGFKVTLNETNQMVFKLYSGEDRTYSQTDLPYVLFSSEFENLSSTEYVEDFSKSVNVALVGGEGEGSSKKYASVGDTAGIERRETYLDASSVSTTTSSGTMTDAQYKEKLQQKGLENITDINKELKEFNCEIDANSNYRYGESFYIGDIVEVSNNYGVERKVRILEYIQSEDTNGYKSYPTFEILNEEA